MPAATALADFQPPSAHASAEQNADKLGEQITELCGVIYAATYRLLVLIREFDEQGYWQSEGLCSCAHWLNFKCGIGMNAAREKVRVAHALKNLPGISAAFEKGQISYSKVRAMTRIADQDNEDYLLMIARHGTAYHVEKLVSKFRRATREQDTDQANQQYADRQLSYYYDESGALIINARLPAEQGALIVKALEMAMEKDFQQQTQDPDVSAETSESVSITTPIATRRADAIAEVAESYLNAEPSTAATADRYQVVVHVSAETLQDAPDTCCIEDGPHVSAETSRRLACDCSILKLTEDQNGEILSIGRKTRAIPPSIRRALRFRDAGCRFPGCTHTHFVDGHHIRHWADGGKTSLENLVQLCRHHHRLVHEGGYTCERSSEGKIEFRSPSGIDLPVHPPIPVVSNASQLKQWIRRDNPTADIDGLTCVSLWEGERMDWDLAVGHLFG
ncbi:MAG: HNH endonuclease [Gammaproteobacteria bacterium]|nr:HNH endonuclease [Gammaproteobacteria bacterium]